MRRQTAIILLLVGVVLLPMWYVALVHGAGGHAEQVVLKPTPNKTLNPLGHVVPMPTETGVYRAGVVSWVALLALGGMLMGAMQYVHRAARRGDPVAATGEDGSVGVPGYMTSEWREVVGYWAPDASLKGVWLVGLFALLDVAFASLLASEVFGLARTQLIGLYAGLLCLSLAETTMLYYAYFMPSIDVAEERDH